mgnify:CR=1 FL=1
MAFEEYSAKQYRGLDDSQLEERRNQLIALAEDASTPDEVAGKLVGESERCKAEFERRDGIAQLRARKLAEASRAIDAGEAHLSERWERGKGVTRGANVAIAERTDDPYDTAEYRNAFMAYIQRGVPVPMELRENQSTLTTDVSPQVPTTMGQQIVSKMSEYGDIWNRVQKLSVKGGLWFRVLDIKPTASWIDEGAVSDTQKVSGNDKVTFSFYQLECRMAQSLLASAVTFDDFQALFVPAVAEAMVRALEQAIIRGTGTNCPLGITKDPRVTNVVEMTDAEFGNWKQWRKKVKAAMPKSYRNGEFIMAQSTFDSYIETMSDDNNAPVSIGYNPVTGEEANRLMGKAVTCVEPDILPDFDTAKAGDVVAVFGDLGNYVVNTQPGMPIAVKRWIDDDSNQEKVKALMACDGKVLDPYGFILIKKKDAAKSSSTTGDK